MIFRGGASGSVLALSLPTHVLPPPSDEGTEAQRSRNLSNYELSPLQ